MQSLDSLQAFAIDGHVAFRTGPGGLPWIDLDGADGSASLCLQGAHLTRFQPRAQAHPLLWLSPQARHARGRSIRGGVPVCWPWFGAHPADGALPAHGFARTVPWEVVDSGVADGVAQLTLRLCADDATRLMWPHDTPLELYIEVGDALVLELTTLNAGDAAVRIGEALHAYFTVGDIAEVEVLGLEGCRYLDKTQGFAAAQQQGPVRFTAETDRIYVDTETSCTIVDPQLLRRIVIDKSGSRSTVVWNPWQQRAQAMGDLGDDGWRRMLCVESANAADNTVELQPGDLHTLRVRYAAQAL